MTCIADIPRARTGTYFDKRRAARKEPNGKTPSAKERCMSAMEAMATTTLAGLLWVLGAAVLAMAMHHLATFGLPFGGKEL